MAERKISGMQKLGLAMAAFGQGMTGQPFASNIVNSWQKQDEQTAENEYRQWQMKQQERELATTRQKIMMDASYKRRALEAGVPVYSMGADGELAQQGLVPKGAKVISPMSLMTPEQKIELEARAQATKEQQLNLGKVKRLYPIIDTIEKEWNKTKPGTRGEGIGKALASPLQVDKNVSSYQSFVKGMRAQLARAMGDVGNLSEPEQKAAMDLVPKVSDSKDVGQEKLNKIRTFIKNLEEGNVENAKGVLSGKTPSMPAGLQKAIEGQGLKVKSFKRIK